MTGQFSVKLAVLGIVGCVVALSACSGGTSGKGNAAAAAFSSAIAAAESGGAATSAAVSGTSAAPVDPCTKLTKSDVQPFFTVPIATELPAGFNDATTKGCTWSAADGSVETSVSMVVRVGDDASTIWQTANTGNPIKFSGVGDDAEHVSGISDFVSIHDGVVCSMTTLGRTHLAPLAPLTIVNGDLLSNSDATAVAQQFGTLCNKIYGTGNTTPTATAAAPSTSASPSPTASVSVPAAGGTLGSTKFPLPQGIDCTGNITVADDDTSCSVNIAGTDGAGIYAFYLGALPANGYTINHEQSQATSEGTTALILFSGGGFDGFSDVNIVNTMLTIDLRS